ncbi:hypothetical protein GCM10010519_45510 [Streptomyces lactacystinicus]
MVRPGLDSGERGDCHGGKAVRTVSWLLGHRRLTVRQERVGDRANAIPVLAAALACDKGLVGLTARDIRQGDVGHEGLSFCIGIPHGFRRDERSVVAM